MYRILRIQRVYLQIYIYTYNTESICHAFGVRGGSIPYQPHIREWCSLSTWPDLLERWDLRSGGLYRDLWLRNRISTQSDKWPRVRIAWSVRQLWENGRAVQPDQWPCREEPMVDAASLMSRRWLVTIVVDCYQCRLPVVTGCCRRRRWSSTVCFS